MGAEKLQPKARKEERWLEKETKIEAGI